MFVVEGMVEMVFEFLALQSSFFFSLISERVSEANEPERSEGSSSVARV